MTNTNQNHTRPSNERMVQANGVGLCIETFGDANDPALLLIGGAAASMDWWEDDFCERLAAGNRFVIRYDARDTGRSVNYPPGEPGYTFRDLAADALGILDALDIEKAHIAGISMGGGIAQLLALEYPDRVATLTLFSTSPVNLENADLPPMSSDLEAMFSEPSPQPDWSDRAAVIDYMTEGERAFGGSIPFDEAHVRDIAGHIFDRTNTIASTMTNHWIIDGGDPVKGRLGQVAALTLVMHGTEDPLFPYEHAEALAREVPGARLVPLEGAGHQYPPMAAWDVVIPALLQHTAKGSVT